MNRHKLSFDAIRAHIEDALLQFKGSRTPEDRYEIGCVDTLCLLRDWLDDHAAALAQQAQPRCEHDKTGPHYYEEPLSNYGHNGGTRVCNGPVAAPQPEKPPHVKEHMLEVCERCKIDARPEPEDAQGYPKHDDAQDRANSKQR